jgi:hypothetical protein
MALPALSQHVGLELLASDPVDIHLLSTRGIEAIQQFVPGWVRAHLKVQLESFRSEVSEPVLRGQSVEECLLSLEARKDVIGAVRSGVSRVLLESTYKNPQLHETIAALPLRLAETLEPTLRSWTSRMPALIFEASLQRTAATSLRFVRLLHGSLRLLPVHLVLGDLMLRPSYGAAAESALRAWALLLCVVIRVEQVEAQRSEERASRVTRELLEELWRVVRHHEMATLAWLVECTRRITALEGDGPAIVAARGLLTELTPMTTTKSQFQALRQEWHWATGHLSNPSQIVNHPSYQAIIALGWPVTPYIFEALEKEEPDFWGNALYRLTGEEPPLPEGDPGTMQGICSAWLNLARERGWTIGESHG